MAPNLIKLQLEIINNIIFSESTNTEIAKAAIVASETPSLYCVVTGMLLSLKRCV
jgi:hypothetical protein